MLSATMPFPSQQTPEQALKLSYIGRRAHMGTADTHDTTGKHGHHQMLC